jgi:two-component system, chemotaxis family, chemotaxis protein CheY
MKLLIVDDSKAMRMIVRRTLRQAGFDDHEVQEAGDGLEALKVMQGWRPDLILSDWNMPNLNGIDLLRRLRAESNDVRFGFVTSEGTEEMRQLATSSGALFLIAKPFDSDTFKSVVGPVLV